ncbi:MAG TPA: glycosyltransferase family 39 protein [Kofleriaceae bacterium]|nr:glycosyltransferase family 39 protein [Kofleriaceae bacterium]
MRRSRIAIAALLLFACAAGLRVRDLDRRINPDAPRWHDRTRAFWHAAGTGDWKAARTHHPGVTLMWLAGAGMQLGGTGGPAPMTASSLRAAKLPLALVGAALPAATFLLLLALWGRGRLAEAWITGALMATEPFLVGASRALHLDMLYTACAWLAILASALACRRRSWRWAVVAGVCLGLGVLTKVVVGAVAVGVAVGFVASAVRKRDRRLGWLLAIVTVTAVATVFLVWPVFRGDPVGTVRYMIRALESEATTGQANFLLGQAYHVDPGALFYPVALLVRTSPELLVLALLGIVVMAARRDARGGLSGWILVGFLPLLVVLCAGDKKFDRYLTFLYPALCYAAAVAAVALFRWLGPERRRVRLAVLAVGLALLSARAVRIERVHPHVVAWAAEWPGLAAEDALTLGAGEGLFEAGEWIRAREGGAIPPVYVASYIQSMPSWVLPLGANDPATARYVVTYLSFWQRELGLASVPLTEHQVPLHEVWIDGRVYARIYAGPSHPGYPVRAP